MNSKSKEEAEGILRSKKMKITLPRVEILAFLMDKKKPITTEEIQKGISGVANLTTTYRTLELFTQKNIVHQADFRDGSVYYEYQTHHHHHVVCVSCGDKESISICVEHAIPVIIKSSKKFTSINDHALEFFGICKICSVN